MPIHDFLEGETDDCDQKVKHDDQHKDLTTEPNDPNVTNHEFVFEVKRLILVIRRLILLIRPVRVIRPSNVSNPIPVSLYYHSNPVWQVRILCLLIFLIIIVRFHHCQHSSLDYDETKEENQEGNHVLQTLEQEVRQLTVILVDSQEEHHLEEAQSKRDRDGDLDENVVVDTVLALSRKGFFVFNTSPLELSEVVVVSPEVDVKIVEEDELVDQVPN